MKVKLESIKGLRAGDQIVLIRPNTKEWISALGMDTLSGTFAQLRFHWTEGSRNLVWDRKINSIDKSQNQVTLDAPITTAIEQKYGGAALARVFANEPLHHVGIENSTLESSYDTKNPKDEEPKVIAQSTVIKKPSEGAWLLLLSASLP